MSQFVYVCPACKAHNPEDAKNCYKCGHWMLSTAYPAQRIKKKSKAAEFFKSLFYVVLIGGAALVAFAIFVAMRNDGGLTTASDTLTFEKMSNEHYIVDQFIVKNSYSGNPSAALDFTLLQEFPDHSLQAEVKASFYDKNNNRIALASGFLPQGMKKGDTSTVRMIFDNGAKLSDSGNVRIEIVFPTMLDTINRISEATK